MVVYCWESEVCVLVLCWSLWGYVVCDSGCGCVVYVCSCLCGCVGCVLYYKFWEFFLCMVCVCGKGGARVK